MIAVDSSVFIAILQREPERTSFMDALKQAEQVLISPATIAEARMVAHRRGGAALVEEFDELLVTAAAQIIPFDAEQADIAHTAFVRFGKGTGHPAQLNFGDLFSYALAKARGVPLLFKGEDFAQTDVARA